MECNGSRSRGTTKGSPVDAFIENVLKGQPITTSIHIPPEDTTTSDYVTNLVIEEDKRMTEQRVCKSTWINKGIGLVRSLTL